MNKQLEQCKIGQGADCCRYLVVGANGFECMKTTISGKAFMDKQVDRMTAKGNNCEGKTNEYLNTKNDA